MLDKKYHFLMYAVDVNLLGEDVQTARRKSEALLVASQRIGLEARAEKCMYSSLTNLCNFIKLRKV
jgi:hypothetical protein